MAKAVSERTIRCFYSSHSSADEVIDFPSSLHFESFTLLFYPDKQAPLKSVKTFNLNMLKHQNANTSNDSSTNLWEEKIKFNKRGKRKLYPKKTSTHQTTNNIRSHEDNIDALSKLVFSSKRIQKQPKQVADETNISTKTPKQVTDETNISTKDYEYHCEPLRQHRRFDEGRYFEEKDSKTAVERTEKLIQLLNNFLKQFCTFHTVFLPLV